MGVSTNRHFLKSRAKKAIFSAALLATVFLIALFPESSPAASPADEWFSVTSFPITTAAGDQKMPAVDGDVVVWSDGRTQNNTFYLYGKSLYGKKPQEYENAADIQLSLNPLSRYLNRLDMKNKTVAFQNYTGNWLLCVRNLNDPNNPGNLEANPESCIVTSTAVSVAISDTGDKVLFDGTQYNNGIQLADFTSGNVSVLDSRTNDTYDTEIFDGFAYWVSYQPYQGRYYEDVLKGAPLDGSTPADNITGSGCGSSLDRNHVRKGRNRVVFAKRDLSSTTGWDIATPSSDPDSEDGTVRCNDPGLVTAPGDQRNPEVSGFEVNGSYHDLVVWEDNRNGDWDIYGEDLETGQELALCVCSGDQRDPDISVDSEGRPFIVWRDSRNSYYDAQGNFQTVWDIYGTKLEKAQTLADRYFPQLRFGRDENFEPAPVEQMLTAGGTFLRKKNDPGFDPVPNPNAAYLASVAGTPDLYVDLEGDSVEAGGGDPSISINRDYIYNNYRRPYIERKNQFPSAVYARVIKPSGSEDTVIQYWLNYYVNDHPELFHEGDWELVQVNLDANLQPYMAAYSNHGNGTYRPWGDVEKSGAGKPVVYVATGSHANYFYAADYSLYPRIWDVAHGDGTVLSPAIKLIPEQGDAAGTEFDWLNFQGQWGEFTGAYVGTGFFDLFGDLRDGAGNPTVQEPWNNPLSWTGECDGCQDDTDEATDLLFTAMCPVDIHLYDVQGRHVGKNSEGGIDEQIPGSEYLEYPELDRKSIVIHGGQINTGYRVEIQSTGSGPANFILTAPDHANSLVDTSRYQAVQITPDTKASLVLNEVKDYTLSIDENGDGAEDSQKVPDATTTKNVDFTPPSTVADLNASYAGVGIVSVSFTAPGDDGNQGTATQYDLRYSSVPITDDNWKDAIPVTTAAPLPVGGTESVSLTDISEGPMLYFGVRALDETALSSQTSNVSAVDVSVLATVAGTATATPAGSSTINVSAPYAGDENNNGSAVIEYRLTGSTDWTLWGNVPHPETQASISGLEIDSTYDVQVTYEDSNSVSGTSVQEIAEIALLDDGAPVVGNVAPAGIITSSAATVTATYSDPSLPLRYTSGINPLSVSVTLDGNGLSGCTATEAGVSCPVSNLAFGAHTIGGSVSDNAGNTASISGGFSMSALTLGLTSRLSTDSAGAEGNGSSYYPMALSADGNYTVFTSQASNLVSGDTNAATDVFVKNNNTGQTMRVSTDSTGAQANGASDKPSISADGRYVAFRSYASNLVTGDTNNTWDIFVKDTQTGTTTRTSTTATGAQANSSSDWTALSADGRFAAFRSYASNLVAGDTNSKWDIFVKDTQTGQVSLISTDSSGVQANGDSDRMAISADGRYVAFRSAATNLTAGDTNGKWDEFVKDTQTNITICLSCIGNGDSGWPSISADGRYVTFPSYATNLVSGDTNNQRDIFVYDMQSGQTTRVSTDSAGTQANSYCAIPVISADGRYIAFMSSSTNLVSGDTNGKGDIFVKDTLAGETKRYSVDSAGTQANNSSDYPAISADGKYIAFDSQASNLVTGDGNGTWDVFVGSRKSPPVVGSVQPSGALSTDSTTISVNYADGGSSGINTASVTVTLDGNTLSGCTVTETSASCPATGLTVGSHIIGGSVSDNEGSQSSISGAFEVIDTGSPAVTNVEPAGITTANPLTISAAFADPAPSSGINPASVTVTLDGSALSGCTATETNVSCPVSSLAFGAHTIGGTVSDNAGNITSINGSFTVSALTPGLTSRLSTDSAGAEGNGSSYYTLSLSQDGNYTAYTSQASNLVSGDTNAATDIFVKNNNTGQTVRASTDSSGAQPTGASEKPSISTDGRYVAFRSNASNLVAGDTNNTWDIFVKDTQTGTTTRVSTDAAGAQAYSSSDWTAISADGRFIAFVSWANNLVAGDTNATNDVFVKDTQTGQITRVTTDSAGVQVNGASDKPAISADGRYVAFRSSASNLVAGDTNGKWDEFVKDTQTGTTICLSCQGNGDSGWPSISADGRYVTFPSYATNLVSGDTNNQRDIFVYDMQGGQTVRVSTDAAGAQTSGYCGAPIISQDGRYVAFFSAAINLVSGDTNGVWDIFRKDTQTGEIVRMSVGSSGGQANGSSDYPAVSADGKYVGFASQASNLVSGDANGVWDVFVGARN